MNIAVYGSNGYLGSAFKETESSVKCLKRLEDPLMGFVHVDFSFPSGKVDEVEFLEYLDLIQRRVRACMLKSSNYVYIASFSSIPPINSIYGMRKKVTEDLVLSLGGNILRMGLVVNRTKPGGRYLELGEKVGKLPFVPVTHHNFFQLFVTQEDAALSSVKAALKSTSQGCSLIADGTFESNLGNVLREVARLRSMKTLNLGIGASRAFEFVVKKCNFKFLDSLKSLTVKRTIGNQENLPMENDAE